MTTGSVKVIQWRRQRKLLYVQCFGGCCGICGYNKCLKALEFHHLDENKKEIGLSASGNTISFSRAKEELIKCICVCANCHREIHSGLIQIPPDIRRFESPLEVHPSIPNCKRCGKICNRFGQLFCSKSCSSASRKNVQYPPKEELLNLVRMNGLNSTGLKFGVTDNSIRKRLKREFGEDWQKHL